MAKTTGVWLTNVDSNVLFDEVALTEALDELQALGFNTLYPTVWQGGYTLYPSEIAVPVTGSLLLHPDCQGFHYPNFIHSSGQPDMLEAIVKLGHAKGFRVIPWFESGLQVGWEPGVRATWFIDDLAKTWLTNDQSGSSTSNAVPGWAWLNPCNQDVQSFLINLIADVVDRYDVDGIQLDDHFAMHFEQGYDQITQKLYFKTPESKRGSTPPSASDKNWMKWRSDQLKSLLDSIFTEVKKIRPRGSLRECSISFSPGGIQDWSYKNFLVNWSEWEHVGFIEELVPQFYRKNLGVFTQDLETKPVIKAQRHIPTVIGIGTRIDGSPINFNLTEKQIQEVSRKNHAGIAIFFYESLWNIIPSGEDSKERKTKLREVLDAFLKP